jgi:hypothetical protein
LTIIHAWNHPDKYMASIESSSPWTMQTIIPPASQSIDNAKITRASQRRTSCIPELKVKH